MSDVGTLEFDEAEVQSLRAYLLKGGFLWVDDFWGPWAWASWEENINRVLPPATYPIRDLTPDHPIFKAMFQVAEVSADSVDSILAAERWLHLGARRRELRAVTSAVSAIPHGNVMVLMTHNTDISDAWEREGEDPRYFYSFSPDGYAVAINALLYGLTH